MVLLPAGINAYIDGSDRLMGLESGKTGLHR
jgi:hypothetical protein